MHRVAAQNRCLFSDMGQLRVDLIDGHGIRGADRSGKSDPYVVFNLNGEKVFKSGVQKKTLTPKWNEHFEVEVPSRTGALFELEVYDWNQVRYRRRIIRSRY
jgi:Ca2+-dependent lipid-binding protein